MGNARVGVLTILLFVTLMLIATLLHLDRFHFGVSGAVARFAAWFWLFVYVIVPLVMLALLAVQVRVPGSDPPRQPTLPSWLAWLIGLQGTVMAIAGAGLFVAPTVVGTVWPWVLTPLTGRAVGAWLIALGVGAPPPTRAALTSEGGRAPRPRPVLLKLGVRGFGVALPPEPVDHAAIPPLGN